ncbi:MAG: hypothetical protein A2Y41_07070 [Spirochaetes bacterium GWB1_36_13]|nr:MAG: hypothetical protein A2Y41_07070 [Spirochaetes bacterium GWB1_36_13]
MSLLAAIDIGANAIRMMIGEKKTDKKNIQVVEKLVHPLRIGKDTFIKGFISPQTLNEVIQTLKGFRLKLEEYDVKNFIVVGTSAIREANNKDFFLEQLRIKSGFQVKIIERTEEERIIFLALKKQVSNFDSIAKKGILLAKVGSGNVEISLMKSDEILFSRSIPIGGLRMRENFKNVPEKDFADLMEKYIESDIKMFLQNSPIVKANYFIGAGTLLKTIYDITGSKKKSIQAEDLGILYKKIKNLSISQIAEKYALPFEYADLLLPTVFTYQKFLSLTKADKILFENLSFSESLLMEKAGFLKDRFFSRKIWKSAVRIGEKYHFDRKHAMEVSKIALKIFDELKPIHNLNPRCRFLLKLAALWHDIGFFIQNSEHHKHSFYLISNIELAGLSRKDIQIIALTARYHRKSPPHKYHPEYQILNSREKVMVSKLSALLRIADALDRSHSQILKKINIVLQKKQIDVIVNFKEDGWLEKTYFQKKKDLFLRIFGIDLELIEVFE